MEVEKSPPVSLWGGGRQLARLAPRVALEVPPPRSPDPCIAGFLFDFYWIPPVSLRGSVAGARLTPRMPLEVPPPPPDPWSVGFLLDSCLIPARFLLDSCWIPAEGSSGVPRGAWHLPPEPARKPRGWVPAGFLLDSCQIPVGLLLDSC